MDDASGAKRRGLTWVAVAYVAAGLVAWVVGAWMLGRGYHPMWAAAGADIVATLVIFGFSVAFDNSSFYDPYWSVAPLPIVAFYAFRPEADDAAVLRQILVAGLVFAWGIRLTWNWMRGWTGLDHEDWRYVDFRKSMGKLYWAVSFTGIHMMPTLWVLGGCLSLWAAMTSSAPIGLLDVLAVLVTAAGIVIEGTADNQLRAFVDREPPPGTILKEGLWGWSRHPNYFGEITFWWGIWLFGVAVGAPWWTALGPLSITLLFVFISLPLIEKRHLARRPGYAEHQKRVSVLVPWPPKQG